MLCLLCPWTADEQSGKTIYTYKTRLGSSRYTVQNWWHSALFVQMHYLLGLLMRSLQTGWTGLQVECFLIEVFVTHKLFLLFCPNLGDRQSLLHALLSIPDQLSIVISVNKCGMVHIGWWKAMVCLIYHCTERFVEVYWWDEDVAMLREKLRKCFYSSGFTAKKSHTGLMSLYTGFWSPKSSIRWANLCTITQLNTLWPRLKVCSQNIVVKFYLGFWNWDLKSVAETSGISATNHRQIRGQNVENWQLQALCGIWKDAQWHVTIVYSLLWTTKKHNRWVCLQLNEQDSVIHRYRKCISVTLDCLWCYSFARCLWVPLVHLD